MIDLDEQRRFLEKRRNDILSQEKSIRTQALGELSPEQTGEISGARLHPADLGSDTQEIETLETLSERNIQTLRDIDDAFERIESGTYGICASCGNTIAAARLKILPETRLCQQCEIRLEQLPSKSPLG